MDIEATLAQLRILVSDVNQANASGDDFLDLTEQAQDFASMFQAMDEWLSKQGYVPAAWARAHSERAVMIVDETRLGQRIGVQGAAPKHAVVGPDGCWYCAISRTAGYDKSRDTR